MRIKKPMTKRMLFTIIGGLVSFAILGGIFLPFPTNLTPLIGLGCCHCTWRVWKKSNKVMRESQ